MEKPLSNYHHRVYTGTVSHNRYSPKQHGFEYTLFYLHLDLDHIEDINQLSRLWSHNKRNFVEYRRSDYFKTAPKALQHASLKQSVCEYLKQKTGKTFAGKIFILTNLRYWGYCFNPISYYFCYDPQGNLQYILDNVTNTPWGKSHIYLHDIQASANSSQNHNTQSDKLVLDFSKTFHVSPFMPMHLNYRSQYKISNEKLLIHMDLFSMPQDNVDDEAGSEMENNKKIFSATMNMHGQTLTPELAMKLPFVHPMQCGKIIFGIYWQALRLWLKRVPFYSYPSN